MRVAMSASPEPTPPRADAPSTEDKEEPETAQHIYTSNASDSGSDDEERVNSPTAIATGNGNGNGKEAAGHHEDSGSESGSGSEHDQESGSEDEKEDDEDDEDDEEEEEDADEEEEDEEPALKYQRITGAIPDLLKKDSASALAVSSKIMALGTHAGIIHILDLDGTRIKSYKPHLASIVDISLDATADFVATASIDGQAVVHSLSTPEHLSYDIKRPLRAIAMEPNFARRKSRAYVCGGLSGALVMREVGWLGAKETVIQAAGTGDGAIWMVRWRGRLIAWANDNGVKIYDTTSQSLIAYIDRPPSSPRADLFKCTLHWQDDSTLIIGWANFIKVARIRHRPRLPDSVAAAGPPLLAEVTSVFQLDCMVAGIVPHPTPVPPSSLLDAAFPSQTQKPHPRQTLTAFLLIAYTPPEAFLDTDEITDDRKRQARKAAERPELRIVSRRGEEVAADALGVGEYWRWGCSDYALVAVPGSGSWSGSGFGSGFGSSANATSDAPEAGAEDLLGLDERRSYIVMSPRDLVRVLPRDRRDHVAWLVERRRYEEALEAVEAIEAEEGVGGFKTTRTAAVGGATATATATAAATAAATVTTTGEGDGKAGGAEEMRHLTAQEIGQMFVEHLVQEGEFEKAAQLCPKVCAHDSKRWEKWIFTFAQKRQLQCIIPFVPTDKPRLDHVVYEMVLGHFLAHDRNALLHTIKEWPREIYDIAAVIVAVRDELDKTASSSSTISAANISGSSNPAVLLMECLAELYTANRQPGKALPFYLRLRRPNVFDLIRDNNLFTDVQDQVLLLVEFDHELMEKRRAAKAAGAGIGGGGGADGVESEAIRLLVDNIHSIPIPRVVQQLLERPYYLFLYLDALVHKDSQLVTEFADIQVKMYAEFATHRLIDFLRSSSSYNLEMAYKECQDRDLVLEMVFLLGRMGNNKKALNLIIERLGDVHRAIDFAKEQSDDDLWEDLLRYSETRPAFIRGLLENVGVEISPIRLIRRIKNGLEIPGLKEALIKILQDFHLQIELLEGCRTVLDGDCAELARRVMRGQSSGFFLSPNTKCRICSRTLRNTDSPHALTLLFLCRHVVHGSCVQGVDSVLLSTPYESAMTGWDGKLARGISGSIAFESMLKRRIGHGCPVCQKSGEAR